MKKISPICHLVRIVSKYYNIFLDLLSIQLTYLHICLFVCLSLFFSFLVRFNKITPRPRAVPQVFLDFQPAPFYRPSLDI